MESSEPSATIYYTTDSTDPTNSSSVFSEPIDIANNTTLKFMAIDPVDNHTSDTVTEVYTIDTSLPVVTAAPPGTLYNSSQSVTLASSEPSATIYYTTDSTDPTNSSSVFSEPIDIATNTTLKFMAIDLAANPSTIYAEFYTFTLLPVAVTSTEPEDGDRTVDVFAVINATFNVPMNGTTIDNDTFLLVDQFGNIGNVPSGIVAYDAITNTASFTPDPFSPLLFGTEYTATLTDEIKDLAGNSLESKSWNFTTGGQISIYLTDVQTFGFIAGSTFTITPDPFTLEGELEVEDNGVFDSDVKVFGEAMDGILVINNVENSFVTYVLTESGVPEGYSEIYGHTIITVVEADACQYCFPVTISTIENLNSTASITDVDRPIALPGPSLDRSQFELYENNVIIGKFCGLYDQFFDDPDSLCALPTFGPILSPDSGNLSPASIVTSTTLNDLFAPDSFNFIFTAPSGSTGPELFELFLIPTYPGLAENIAAEAIYAVPPIVIPYEDSKNFLVMTPIIDEVFPGLTLSLQQESFVESNVAKVDSVNMTFSTQGNDVGFSFGITDTPPPGTTAPPLDAQALFLDVGFVGDVDFSDPESFDSPPRIDILVNKTLSGFDELPDGCIDFVMLLFDENDEEWREVQKLRNPTLDSGSDTPNDPTDDKCGFTLEPPHFSKFAVGGIKGSIVAAEAILVTGGGGGGGGGRDGNSATSIQQMVSGEEVAVTTDVGSESVTSLFEFVAPGSGQLKIESDPVTKFEKLFDEMADVQQQETEKQGIVHLNDAIYSTVGTVFDIDSSNVNFSGTFNVTIPYKEDIVLLSLGSESDVRLLHYNSELEQWEDITIGRDEKANTVTGRMMNSSSPVVAALIVGDTPVEKIGISSTALSNANFNSRPWQVSSREQVTLSVTMNNIEELSSSKDQSIMLILQTLDEDGVVVDITFQTVMLETAMSGELAESWVEDDPGMYRIEILIWSSLDEPASLSDAAFTPMIKVIQ